MFPLDGMKKLIDAGFLTPLFKKKKKKEMSFFLTYVIFPFFFVWL